MDQSCTWRRGEFKNLGFDDMQRKLNKPGGKITMSRGGSMSYSKTAGALETETSV